MNKHLKKETLLTILFAIILIATVSFAYFAVSVSNTNNEKINATSSTVSIKYTDCGTNKQSDCANITKNLVPGESVEKTFRVQNTGTVSTGFEVIFKELSNTFVNNELVYKVVDSDNNEIVGETPVPYGTNQGTTIFVSPIATGQTKEYKMIVTFKETTGDQNANLTATYSIKLGIRSSSTVVAQNTFSKLQILNHDYAIKTATPNFANISPMPSKYRDDGMGESESNYNIPVNTSYITYGDSYTFNESTGRYTLVNPQTCKWNECYQNLIGKYYCYNLLYTNTGLHNISNQLNLYQITANSTDSDIKYKTNTKTVIEYDDLDTGIFKMEDDYGNSLYFRGNVQNNYVKFGKNTSNQDMYWRIIRINGDGTLRILYDGTSAHTNGDTSEDRIIGSSTFNSGTGKPYDAGYVGYMYGNFTTPTGCSCTGRDSAGNCIYTCTSGGSTSYNEAHANINSSSIKTYLENWYENNIENTVYSTYVSDEIFCNDRSIDRDARPDDLGYGQNTTIYAPYTRNSVNKNPSLLCPQKNDAFTKADTINGNGKLTYPVGLITIDELSIGGNVWGGDYNAVSYLRKGSWYWSFSSSNLTTAGRSAISVLNSTGNSGYAGTNATGGVAPVINLNADAVSHFTGDGTASNPFTISP